MQLFLFSVIFLSIFLQFYSVESVNKIDQKRTEKFNNHLKVVKKPFKRYKNFKESSKNRIQKINSIIEELEKGKSPELFEITEKMNRLRLNRAEIIENPENGAILEQRQLMKSEKDQKSAEIGEKGAEKSVLNKKSLIEVGETSKIDAEDPVREAKIEKLKQKLIATIENRSKSTEIKANSPVGMDEIDEKQAEMARLKQKWPMEAGETINLLAQHKGKKMMS